jgi:hypothetical protein
VRRIAGWEGKPGRGGHDGASKLSSCRHGPEGGAQLGPFPLGT